MAFDPPIFNVTFRSWTQGTSPGNGDPFHHKDFCQLYLPTRTMWYDVQGFPGSAMFVPEEIRFDEAQFPAVGIPLYGQIWKLELGGFVGPQYYRVTWWDKVHPEFPNAYILMYVLQCDDFGNIPDGNR